MQSNNQPGQFFSTAAVNSIACRISMRYVLGNIDLLPEIIDESNCRRIVQSQDICRAVKERHSWLLNTV